MDTKKLAETFVTLADTLVDDFDVLDLLHVLTRQCVDLLDADAVGLMLADTEGELRITVASSESARLLDLLQLQNDEGPCLECFHAGQPVGAERLADMEERWPEFAPAAQNAGFATVLALPLRLRGQTIGALNLFGGSSRAPIGEAEIPVAQAMADVATIAILQDRLARDRNLLTDQLQTALNSRVAIEQAKGALSNQFDIDTNEAFDRLRHRARSTNRRLVEVADEVVTKGIDLGWQPSRGNAGTDPTKAQE
jgi:GAF domain-containing protein